MAKHSLVGVQGVAIGAEYTQEELAFLNAVEAYKALHKRRFPTFVEILNVAKALGYRKVASCYHELRVAK